MLFFKTKQDVDVKNTKFLYEENQFDFFKLSR